MSKDFWAEFAILVGMGLFGILTMAVYPALQAASSREKVKGMPLPVILLLQLFFNGAMVTVASFLGLKAARGLGLGAPYLERLLGVEYPVGYPTAAWLPLALGFGVAVAAISLAVDRFLGPAILASFWRSAPAWQRFLFAFYGGITEEILMRLFLLSGVAYLLVKLGLERGASLWTANASAALIFGALHLPTASRIAPLRGPLVAKVLFLNGVAGLLFGYLYVVFGLEAAMASHFAADLLLHGLGSIAFGPAVEKPPA